MQVGLGVACIATSLLSGCAALREPSEIAWQGAHLIDTAQTYSAAHDRCYGESESAWLIGEHPNDTSVAAWSIGMAGAHVAVTQLLIDYDHPTLARWWGWLTFADVAGAVGHNYSIGVRIGGSNKPVNNCN